MKRTISLLLSLVLLLSLAACGRMTLSDEQKETLRQEAQTSIDQTLFKGAVYATVGGEEVLSIGSGKADKDADIDNSADIAYQYASVSKQFTAAAIMLLYEQGKLDLHNAIDKYFPEYDHGKEITIHDLLCMRSGLIDLFNNYDVRDDGAPVMISDNDIEFEVSPDKSSKENRTAIEEWIFSQPLRFEPGSDFEYCSSGYMLLGEIVEQASGTAYEDFLRENIFEPLGMTSAGFSHSPGSATVAKAYHRGEGMDWTECPGARFGSGDIVCSPRDMVKWADALMHGRVVSKDSWKLMTTVYSSEDPDMPYGYGLLVNSSGGRTIIGHTGHFPSYYSILVMIPEEEYICSAVSNHSNVTTEGLGSQITKSFKEIKYGK